MFALAGAAYGRGATPKELVVNLKFKPQEGVHSSSANIPPSMLDKSVDIRVEDGRGESEPVKIGQGTGGDDKTFPIKSATDIKPFIDETLESVAKSFGLKVSEKSGDRVLVITVTRFYIDETNKALGSVYSSEVKLAYTLKTSGGKTLAEGCGDRQRAPLRPRAQRGKHQRSAERRAQGSVRERPRRQRRPERLGVGQEELIHFLTAPAKLRGRVFRDGTATFRA